MRAGWTIVLVFGCGGCALGDPESPDDDALPDAGAALDTILPSPPTAIAEPPLSIPFEATRAATFECSLDGAAFAPCTSPFEIDELGPHALEVRAVAGDDVDESPARAETTLVQNAAHPNIAIVEAGEGWSDNDGDGLLLEWPTWPRQVRPFYEAYPDDYQSIVVWTDFHSSSAMGVPFSAPLKNDVAGVGLEWYFRQPVGVGHRFAEAGSEGALEVAIFMQGRDYWDAFDWLDVFWDGKVHDVLAQEFAHRWLSYFRLPGDDRDALLDDWGAHWDFNVGLDAPSPMGYWMEPVEDGGEGTFTARLWTEPTRFSSLDLYGMGLAGADEVADGFWVRTEATMPGNWVSRGSFTFAGERVDFDVDDLILANGARVPSVADSPKTFRQAFVLVVEPGAAPSDEGLVWFDGVRRDWEAFFQDATGGRGEIDTALWEATREE